MVKKAQKIFLFFSCLSAFFLKAGFVFATEITYPSLFGFSVNDTSSLPEYIKYFFGVGSGLAITAAVFAIIFGGILFLVDYGRGKTMGEGVEWVKAGLLGLVITLSAYLILYTINPNLTNLKLDGLPQIFSNDNSFFSSNPNNPEVKIYRKIPVGTLAENLLTKTMDCYDYDLNGNPIEGYKIKTDNGKELYGPTYIEHDRVDCFSKLADAADKKANIINKLAIEIKKLMDTCTCSGKCKSPCLDGKKAEEACGQPKECSGPCSECHDTAACASIKKENIQDIFNSGFSYADDGTCDTATRNKIEGNEDPKESGSGILIYSESGESGNQEGISYFGLKEFRSEYSNDYERIKQYVEIQPKPKVNEKELTIFNSGNCKTCGTCSEAECNPADKNYDTCVKEKQKCQEEKTKCEGERKTCLKKNSPWYKLRLVDQLTYLKGKMAEIKSKIEEDKKQVENAVADVNSCYLVRSSAELAKIKEKTDQKITLISVTNTYVDKETNNPIGDKYCTGFGYENSSCFEYCNNVCPDISADNKIYDCYKDLPVCKDPQDAECLKTQNKAAQKCFNEKKCTLGAFEGTFAQCIASCQNNCTGLCEKKYAKGSDQYNGCKTICENNSQCLLDNENQCLLNSQVFLTCANESIDQGTAQHCLENAYLCQYGSDQYAGYPECLKRDDALKENYAASYIVENKDKQLCPEPFKVDKNSLSTCQEQNPQTAKCPASSRCPSSSSNVCTCEDLGGKAFFSVYGHMENINLSVGQQVQQGDIIGTASDIGGSGWAHLHFAVGFENPGWKDIRQSATSFDISSKIMANGGTTGERNSGTYANQLPSCATSAYQKYVLDSLTSPIDTNGGRWVNKQGSFEHSQEAFNAQDWMLLDNEGNNITKSSNTDVKVMSGGPKIKSTVVSVDKNGTGGVVIKHELDSNTLSSLLNCDNTSTSSTSNTNNNANNGCPCTSLDNTFNFELPAKITDTKPVCVNNKKQQVPAEEDTPDYSSADGREYVGNGIAKITVTQENKTRSVKLNATNLVGPECSDYSYDEDPLTFYCQNEWWKKNAEGKGPDPIGGDRSCSLAKEIPVGQAVDDSITWANNFKEKSDKMITAIDKIVNYVKQIGEKRNYCMCDSKYDQDPFNEGNSGKPICSTSCTPVGPVPILDKNGVPTGKMTKPSCAMNECGGNSCQQMIDYLLAVNALYKEIKIEFSNIFLLPIADERTEVLKKITYSRTKTDECSVSATEFGNETILLNCERVLDEVVPPVIGGELINDAKKIKNYCYGKQLNKVGGTAGLDNWFCCDLNVKNSTTK